MKQLGWWLGVVATGLVLGVGSAGVVLWLGQSSGAVAVGPWTTNVTFGSTSADMYTRTRVALVALFANNSSETLYYRATSDSDGAPLSGDCSYLLEGTDLPARWWSIAAYGPDNFLIANEANVYSRSRSTVEREANGHFVIRVSSAKQDGDWLPVKAGESFDLTARLYNPDASVSADPASAALPRIVRESCR